jgi:hypothetical protein
MQSMETLHRNPWPLYLLGGLFLGTFIGYKVLPQLVPATTVHVAEQESESQLHARQQLESGLAAGLARFDAIKEAHVQLSVSLPGTRKASPTAAVTIIDASGRVLNYDALVQH